MFFMAPPAVGGEAPDIPEGRTMVFSAMKHAASGDPGPTTQVRDNRHAAQVRTGVAPHPRQSGASRPRGRCQAGRAPVRAVLYMATLAAIRCKTSSLRAFYQRLRANGKPFKLAIVAAMRKFIVTLNTMLSNHQDWHPQPT
jgi:hypothetical protein